MLLRSLIIFGVVGILAAAPSQALAAKGKKGGKAVRGMIESVDTEKGTMVIKVHQRKKKKDATPAPAPTEKTVKFSSTTKVEVGRRKDAKAGTLSDLKKGARVAIFEKDGQAEKIRVHEGKKGKKKKAATN